MQLLQSLPQGGKLLSQLRLHRHVRLYGPVQKGQHFLYAANAAALSQLFLQLADFLRQWAARLRLRIAKILDQAPFQHICRLNRLSPAFPQLQFHGLVALGHEDVPQNAGTFLGFGIQKPPELPLGNHGQLLELLFIHMEKLLHRLIDRLDALDRRIISRIKHRLLLFQLKAGASLQGAHVGGLAVNPIYPALMGKSKLHIALRPRRGILAAQAVRAAVAAAGSIKEGEADGIKNHGLPGTCFPGNQNRHIQIKALKIYLRHPVPIGADAADNQLNGLHPLHLPLHQSPA